MQKSIVVMDQFQGEGFYERLELFQTHEHYEVTT